MSLRSNSSVSNASMRSVMCSGSSTSIVVAPRSPRTEGIVTGYWSRSDPLSPVPATGPRQRSALATPPAPVSDRRAHRCGCARDAAGGLVQQVVDEAGLRADAYAVDFDAVDLHIGLVAE